MDKENEVYTHDGILFSLKKDRNPAIYNHIYTSGGHYAELNNPGTQESDLSEKSEIVRLIEAESRMVVSRDWWRGNRKLFFQGIKFQLCKIYQF